jgi:hypothetical protein
MHGIVVARDKTVHPFPRPRTGPRFIASSGGRWLPNVIIGRQSADVRFARGSSAEAGSAG